MWKFRKGFWVQGSVIFPLWGKCYSVQHWGYNYCDKALQYNQILQQPGGCWCKTTPICWMNWVSDCHKFLWKLLKTGPLRPFAPCHEMGSGSSNRGVAILHLRVPIPCRSMPRLPREFLRPGLWGERGEPGRILVNLRAGRWVIMDYWIVWPYLHCSFGPSPKASETSK